MSGKNVYKTKILRLYKVAILIALLLIAGKTLPLFRVLTYASQVVTIPSTTHYRSDFAAGSLTNIDTSASAIKLNNSSTSYPLPPDSYTYIRRVPIVNNSATDSLPAGYQVQITFDHASLTILSKSLASGDDVRVFYNNGSWVELERWAENGWNIFNTKVWFKLQASVSASSTDNNYYLVYGKPSAVNPPANGNNIFEFFDDFESSLSEAKWPAADRSGAPDVINGKLRLDTDEGIYASNYTIPDNTTWESSANPQSLTIRGSSMRAADSKVNGYVNDGNLSIVDILWYGGTLWREWHNGEQNESSYAADYKKYRIDYKQSADEAVYYYDDTNLGTDGGTVPAFLHPVFWAGFGGQSLTDYFFVRKYVPSEPTAQVGAEGIGGGGAVTNYVPRGTLISNTIDTQISGARIKSLSWETSGAANTNQPNGAELKFQVATSEDGSTFSAFKGPNNAATAYFTTASGHNASYPIRGRYFKYKAFFSSADGAVTPSLYSLTLNFYRPLVAIESIKRVNTGVNGEESNATVFTRYRPAVSSDGRYVTFHSWASNIVPNDTNASDDIFKKDTQTGQIWRVSVGSGGGEGNSSSTYPSASFDQRYVAFESTSTNLVAGDNNNANDIFLKDTQTGTTTRITTSSQEFAGSYSPSVSGDGRYLAFYSLASNLVANDNNGVGDVFLYDRETTLTTRVSTSSDSQEGDSQSYAPALSSNGRYIVFMSTATNLVANDTNGAEDVFVKDILTGQTTRISVNSSGTEATWPGGWWLSKTQNQASISADGRYVAFQSNANNLIANDTNTSYYDIFVKDRQGGAITLINSNSAGVQAVGNHSYPVISANGRQVAFQSLDRWDLVYGAFADPAIFLKDIYSGEISLISTDVDGYLDTNGPDDSDLPGISYYGNYVVYYSKQRMLVENDTNNYEDIFLTKVDSTQPGNPTISSSTHSSSTSFYSNKNPSFTFSSTDMHSIAGYSYLFDQSPATEPDTASETSTGSLNLTNVSDGTWYLHLRAVDAFDNWGQTSHLKVNIETVYPVISSITSSGITSNSWQKKTSNPTFNINASDNLSGLKKYDYYWGTSSSGLLKNESTASTLTPGAVTNGTYYLKVKATDNATNESSISQFIFKYDQDKPALSMSTLDTSKYHKGKIRLKAKSSDGLSGFKRIEFYVGSKIIKRSSSPAANFYFNTAKYNGKRKISVRAYDFAGNKSSASQTIMIDNYKPKTYAPLGTTVKRGERAKLYYKVSDPYSGSKAFVKIKIRKGKKLLKTINIGLTKINRIKHYDFNANLAEGMYKFYVYASDVALNKQANIASNYLIIN